MKEIMERFRESLTDMRIDEAIDKLLEANPIHDKDTGRFKKGKAESGDVYSLSKPAADAEGIDPKYAYRAVATGNTDPKTGEIKTKAKFGANSTKPCGRRKPNGEYVNPKLDCSEYPKPYIKEQEMLLDDDDKIEREGDVDVNDRAEERDRAYWRSTIRQAIKDEIQRALKSNSCSLNDITIALDRFSRSSKGSLHKDPSKK